ncbi:hypothetical protein PHMEG_00039637 [Phytophthora megakarya]|uniref:Uncharacterized protein n=1 Tax=Phytophthora megakarya TaxID=4795 RepID=A0A225UF63_9STRA|nr:hypothetical protein PHMEG_00039637 [Phytophthora megakarya]
MLSLVVNAMYAPLRKTKAMCDPEAVSELVTWIDDCFELFRSCLAREDTEATAQVKDHFQFSHESYARVNRWHHIKGEICLPHKRFSLADNVEASVVVAKPYQFHQQLLQRCLSAFLSADGCSGDGDICVFGYKCHFVPNKLPAIVKNHIIKAFGG